jgi:hypothetical protein
MVGKLNQLGWRHALVAGLVFLGYNMTIEASLPNFGDLTDRVRFGYRFSIAGAIADVNKMGEVVAAYLNKKGCDPNLQIMYGLRLPVSFYAASLPNPSDPSKKHPLKILLENDDLVLNAEGADGSTPCHIAAKNSLPGLQLLIDDGRLDINECDRDGKSPLYVALECNSSNSHERIIDAILKCKGFILNSRSNMGQTMLHVAIIEGNWRVGRQIFALDTPIGTYYGDQQLDVNVTDSRGDNPADYLYAIDNEYVRAQFQDALAARGARYGVAGPHIASFADGNYTYGAHAADDVVVGVVTE